MVRVIEALVRPVLYYIHTLVRNVVVLTGSFFVKL